MPPVRTPTAWQAPAATAGWQAAADAEVVLGRGSRLVMAGAGFARQVVAVEGGIVVVVGAAELGTAAAVGFESVAVVAVAAGQDMVGVRAAVGRTVEAGGTSPDLEAAAVVEVGEPTSARAFVAARRSRSSSLVRRAAKQWLGSSSETCVKVRTATMSGNSVARSRDAGSASAVAGGPAAGREVVADKELVGVAVAVVEVDSEADRVQKGVGSNLLPAVEHRKNSCAACRTTGKEPEVAKSSAAVAAHYSYPSAAHCWCSSSPFRPKTPVPAQKVCWDTYSISAVDRIDLKSMRWPFALQACDHNTSRPSQACCAGLAACRAYSLSRRTF